MHLNKAKHIEICVCVCVCVCLQLVLERRLGTNIVRRGLSSCTVRDCDAGWSPGLHTIIQGVYYVTMANLINTTGAIKKLNMNNYSYWKTCIESYLQGQDLWEVVGGGETGAPQEAGDAL